MGNYCFCNLNWKWTICRISFSFFFLQLFVFRFDFLLHQGNAFLLLLMFLCLWPETGINCLVLRDSLLTLKWAFCPLKWKQYEIEAIWSCEPWSFHRGATALLESLEMIGPIVSTERTGRVGERWEPFLWVFVFIPEKEVRLVWNRLFFTWSMGMSQIPFY